MRMSYFLGVSTLVSFVSVPAIAQQWEQARSEGHATFSYQAIDNLYLSAAPTLSTHAWHAGVHYDWMDLFEGYALALPVSFERQQFNAESSLNHSDWQVSPAAHLFLDEALELTVRSTLAERSALPGAEANGFYQAEQRLVTRRDRNFELELQIGRAPERHHLQILAGQDHQRQSAENMPQLQIESRKAGLEYALRWNEQSQLLASYQVQWQQRNDVKSDLQEFGFGVASRWGQRQTFKLLAGLSRRDQQGANDQQGHFWHLTNETELSDDWRFDLTSSRHSVISSSASALTQLQTAYAAGVRYRLTDDHQLSVAYQNTLMTLEGQQQQRRFQNWQLAWDWRYSTQWQLHSQWSSQQLADNLLSGLKPQQLLELGIRWSW